MFTYFSSSSGSGSARRWRAGLPGDRCNTCDAVVGHRVCYARVTGIMILMRLSCNVLRIICISK